MTYGVAVAARGALVLAAAAWPFVEPLLPALRRVRVPVLPPDARAGGRPLTVLHVSDLHLLPRHTRRAAWVRALARLRPDLVVSTGDHVSSARSIPLLLQTLGALTADGTPGVFVPGNNDYFSPVRPRPTSYLHDGPPRPRSIDLPWASTSRRLQDAGWTDVTHRRTVVEVAGTPVTVTGTDDAHLRRDRYDAVSGPVDGLGLGVTHTPQRSLLEAFAADGHALVLAGHTHGGQLRLPGLGPAVTNCDLERDRARGLSRLVPGSGAGGWLHVSAGLGTSPYLPVRLCCRPEATLLTLVERT
ncbi:MAG: putative secreted protein [uncultured Frankineae bacterium]|uniref:Putative secreted protein n=1 Tax=uncultured Frankineae bacterium TaxID=437475 RepID=A0A6J4M5P7_9ACTN|nr:MAG: putative secreted protein [uncultured Frankineae bacterium]